MAARVPNRLLIGNRRKDDRTLSVIDFKGRVRMGGYDSVHDKIIQNMIASFERAIGSDFSIGRAGSLPHF
jgi:hypothetical protein